MNTNQKPHHIYKAEDIDWKGLKAIGIYKEQMETDGNLDRLLQGEATEAVPVRICTPPIDLGMDATLRLVPGTGGKPVLEIKGISPEETPEV